MSKLTDMVTVYLSDAGKWHNYGIHAILVPELQVERVLAKTEWDLGQEEGHPGSVEYYADESRSVEYLRYGNDYGFEPLVIERSFHGLREDYLEIAEEFRLFHRLYHDKKNDKFYKIDDAGNEELVALIENGKVMIRMKEIRQFLAIKEMCLSIQLDWRELSSYSLAELGKSEGGCHQRIDDACWNTYYGEMRMLGYDAIMRITGKRIVRALPKSKSGMWGFSEEAPPQFVDFITDLDDNGDEQFGSCDPSRLNPAFLRDGAHLQYLTPIHFRKGVLDKYFQQPSKYRVDDSMLWCGNLWSMTLDNHQKDQVVVWLGDLGQLPHGEQLHWRSYNVAPAGLISDTFRRRQLLSQFADSNQLEHRFHAAYQNLQEAFQSRLGWTLLLPLDKGDQHHLRGVRVPATDEQKEFDELVLGLTKMLIDSINEQALARGIDTEIKGGINRLDAFLRANNVEDVEVHISFLLQLQALRSSSSAHRKGNNYRKISRQFGLESHSLSDAFADILRQAVEVLVFLAHAANTIQPPGADFGSRLE